MREVTARSWVLPHLPADREDSSERQLGSDPRIWGFDPLTHTNKPLQSPGHCVERPRGASIARVITSTVSGHNLYLQPLRERTRWEATRPGSSKSIQTETGLSPLSHSLHADATFLIPRDLPLLSLPLLCPLPPLLFPPQRAGPARSLSRV